jgi:hypothetical protein
MITVSETVEIRAAVEAVFAHVDDIRNLGWHMTGRSSMAMMGSRLKLEILSDQRTGLGATYRYSGTVMGLSIDFSESVTKYLPPREKVWRTIGKSQLLIIASVRDARRRRAAVTDVGAADDLDRLRVAPLSVLADRGPVTGSTV